MCLRRLILTAIMVGAAASTASAQQPIKPSINQSPPISQPSLQQTIVVGIIDIGTVLRGSSAAQGLQQQMRDEQKKYQEVSDQEQNELRLAEEELERERASLAADVYAEKRRVFQQRFDRAGNDLRLRRAQLEEAFSKANAAINQTLSATVEELATKNGVTLILRREAVLFQKDAIDITDATIALLNEKLPSVVIALPAPR